MIDRKRVSLVKGLLFAASVGLTPTRAAQPDDPAPPRPVTQTPTPADADRYLLLTDGRLISGRITRDSTHYIVAQKLGVIRFPKRQVERSFDTVREAYQYRLERVPEEDPVERLRLARWCLNLRLTDEARAQLQKVLEISPEHDAARAMLDQLSRTQLSRMDRTRDKVDAAVRQTAAEDVAEDRGAAVDSAVLRSAERRMGITGLPVIFDLPTPLAIQRTEQFKRYVHPILQAFCARCHNGAYDGEFQLVPASTARQRTPDVLRANLDATLRQIDSEDPARSELLMSTLRPHGVGSRRRPIFTGSNDRAFQILSAWVHSLRPSGGSAVAAAQGVTGGEGNGEAFAADRNRAGRLEPLEQGIGTGDPRRLPTIANPAGSMPAGRASRDPRAPVMLPDDRRQDESDPFPLPYMLGGPRPRIPAPASTRGATRSAAPTAKAAPAAGPNGASLADPADAAAKRTDPAATGPGGGGSRPGTSPAKKKPVKLDPAMLQKLLQKNNGRPTGE